VPDPYKGFDLGKEPQSAPRGRNHLLVIAIDEYAHCPRLHNCVKDAREFIDVLAGKYQFDPENITTLFNAKATRPNIHTQFKKLKDQVGPEDNLVLYFSGHGETEDNVGYWVPANARPGQEWEYFSTDEIKRRLDAINSFHTFVIVDACFSGSLFSTFKSAAAGYESKRSRWGLAASHSRERALDGTPGENSPFAATLLRQLKESRDDLAVQELAAAVIRQVERATEGRQTPVFKPLNVKGDDEGQYVFHLKANEAAGWKACREAGTLAAYQAFLAQYPEGVHARAARAALAELEEEAAWEEAKAANTILSYYQYNQRYPSGKYRAEALAAIKQLEEEQAWQQARRAGSLSAFLEYKERYPQGRFAAEAEGQIEAILAGQREPAAWQEAKGRGTAAAYEAYLQNYPQGPHAPEAREAAQELSRKAEAERARQEEEARQRKLQEAERLRREQEAAGQHRRQEAQPVQKSPEQAKPAIPWKKWMPVGAGVLAAVLVVWGISQWAGRGVSPGIPNENAAAGQEMQSEGEQGKDSPSIQTGTVTLKGQTYKTFAINGKTWLAENLNYDVPDSWCYGGKPANCQKYGRLYTWAAAKKACAALGAGWRVPTDAEWKSLANAYGGYYDWPANKDVGDPKKSYKALLEGGSSGFSALLGGWRYADGSSLNLVGNGHYWSATEDGSGNAWNYYVSSDHGLLYRNSDDKGLGLSCRCVQD